MDEFNKIRKEFHLRKKSIYQIAKEYNRSWETISNIVKMPEHKVKERGTRPKRIPLVTTPEIENKILEYLNFEIDNNVHKKQRYTAAFIYNELKSAGIYKGSSKSLRTLVAKLRKENNLNKEKGFLELDFKLGEYLQVDHGPVEVIINDKRLDGYLFVATVPGYCLRFCQVYLTKASEAWGKFHEGAFLFFGGKFPKVIYDNDTVLKVPKTESKTNFCQELELHYKFEAIFCNKAAGWEKGAVENSVGYCRRNFLAGLKQTQTLDDLNSDLYQKCLNNIKTKIHYKTKNPLSKIFSELNEQLEKINSGKEWGRWTTLKVNKFQLITYQGFNYSVPEKYIDSNLECYVSVDHINIYRGNDLIVSHKRLYSESSNGILLDHYLEQLLRKPRAIKYAKVMKNEKFPDCIIKLRENLYLKYSEKEAGINLIQTLMLQRVSSKEDFITSIELSLSFGGYSYQAIKSILNQLQTTQNRTIENFEEFHTNLDQIKGIDNSYNLDKFVVLEQRSLL